jgi:hypothetical protein
LPGFIVADRDYGLGEWTSGKKDCSPVLAASSTLVPDSVNTLSGWSRGRLGPMYFLAYAGSTRVSRIHRIILFDPGTLVDMEGPETCDTTIVPSINYLLSGWLASDPQNTLLILTGNKSEDHEFGSIGRSYYNGLWKYYIKEIWNKPYANRAMICDYNNYGHDQVLSTFAWIVNHTPSGCPTDPAAPTPTAWHP